MKVIHRLLAMAFVKDTKGKTTNLNFFEDKDFQAILHNPCGNYIWVGQSKGFTTKLDVEPLSIHDEIMAKLLQTRRTYAIRRSQKSFTATLRIGITINIKNAPILGSHICDPSTFKFGATPPEDYWGRDKSKTYQGEGVPF